MRTVEMSSRINLMELKPCPKCKKPEGFCETTIDEEPMYFVLCNNEKCGFETPDFKYRPQAIEHWNNLKL